MTRQPLDHRKMEIHFEMWDPNIPWLTHFWNLNEYFLPNYDQTTTLISYCCYHHALGLQSTFLSLSWEARNCSFLRSEAKRFFWTPPAFKSSLSPTVGNVPPVVLSLQYMFVLWFSPMLAWLSCFLFDLSEDPLHLEELLNSFRTSVWFSYPRVYNITNLKMPCLLSK